MRPILFVATTALIMPQLACHQGHAREGMRVHTSENAEFAALLSRDDGGDVVTLYRYDERHSSFLRVRSLSLPTSYRPQAIAVSNDGEHCIVIGDSGGSFEMRIAAIIFDVKRAESTAVPLQSILPTPSIRRRHTIGPERMQVWYESFYIDQRNKRIYVRGVDRRNGAASGAWNQYRPPTYVIDIVTGSVRVLSRESNPLASDRERHLFQSRLLGKRMEQFEGKEQRILRQVLRELVAETVKEASVEHKLIDGKLVRLVPGDERRSAKLVIMGSDPGSGDYKLVKTLKLVNPIAPAPWNWHFSKDMSLLVTFDDIHRVGVTKNTIVVYDLRRMRHRAFSITDFCTKVELDNILSSQHLRMWRHKVPWVTIRGSDHDNWIIGEQHDMTGILPHIIIDVDELKVRLAQPFRQTWIPSPGIGSFLDK